MQPDRPIADAYDGHYQIRPHFEKTPGLTAIPHTSPNYNIHRHLKRNIAALYTKHGLERCPSHGLFWAGWPQWTMIPDRDKIVFLVVELKAEEIKSWWKMDAEVRALLDETRLTEPSLAERGVCVRYHQFWDGWKEEQRQEQDIHAEIQVRERRELENPTSMMDAPTDSEFEVEFSGLEGRQLVEPRIMERGLIPPTLGLPAENASISTGKGLRRIPARAQLYLREPPPPPSSRTRRVLRASPRPDFPLDAYRMARRTGPASRRRASGQAGDANSTQRPFRNLFIDD